MVALSVVALSAPFKEEAVGARVAPNATTNERTNAWALEAFPFHDGHSAPFTEQAPAGESGNGGRSERCLE